VFDDETVYGYGRLWQYYRWTTPLEFSLFAAKKQPEIVRAGIERKAVKKNGKRVGTRPIPVTRFAQDWSDDISVQVNSMVLTEGALFAAGPPDVADEEAAGNRPPSRANAERCFLPSLQTTEMHSLPTAWTLSRGSTD
jgi:hypothetical protein